MNDFDIWRRLRVVPFMAHVFQNIIVFNANNRAVLFGLFCVSQFYVEVGKMRLFIVQNKLKACFMGTLDQDFSQ